MPTESAEEVVNDALPPDSVPVARAVVPSRKVTTPLGVPEPGETALTVAVNVTAWPNTDGSGAPLTVVVVLALATAYEVAGDVLARKFALPR